jgi:GxxExxY protein
MGLDVEDDPLSRSVIGAAIAVHKALGPGLLESAYQRCVSLELKALGIPHKREVVIPIEYRGETIEDAYRLDLVGGDRLIVEVKSVERLLPVHEAHLLTYLRLARKHVGLLLNFHTPYLRDGIKRLVL